MATKIRNSLSDTREQLSFRKSFGEALAKGGNIDFACAQAVYVELGRGNISDERTIKNALIAYANFIHELGTLPLTAEQKKSRRLSMRVAAEFGYKACEVGENIQLMLSQFDTCMGAADEFSKMELK